MHLFDIERQGLKVYIPRLIETVRPDLELERAFACADVAVRVFARLALAAAGLRIQADMLGALEPVDRESSESAQSAASAAELAARSAASTSEWALTESMRSARGLGPVGDAVGVVGGALHSDVVGVGGRVDGALGGPVGGIGGGSGAIGREASGVGAVGGVRAPRSPHRDWLLTTPATTSPASRSSSTTRPDDPGGSFSPAWIAAELQLELGGVLPRRDETALHTDRQAVSQLCPVGQSAVSCLWLERAEAVRGTPESNEDPAWLPVSYEASGRLEVEVERAGADRVQSGAVDQPTESPWVDRTVNTGKPDSREMALRGRIGAFRLHATFDPRDATRSARKAFMDRFERLVDPDCSLPTRKRQRRAEAARMAYYAQLARLSATARRRRKGSPISQQRASPG